MCAYGSAERSTADCGITVQFGKLNLWVLSVDGIEFYSSRNIESSAFETETHAARSCKKNCSDRTLN